MTKKKKIFDNFVNNEIYNIYHTFIAFCKWSRRSLTDNGGAELRSDTTKCKLERKGLIDQLVEVQSKAEIKNDDQMLMGLKQLIRDRFAGSKKLDRMSNSAAFQHSRADMFAIFSCLL